MTTENSFKSSGPIRLSELAEFLGISGQISMSDLYDVPGNRIAVLNIFAPDVSKATNVPIAVSQFYGMVKKFEYVINITGNHIDRNYLNVSTLLTATSLPAGISRQPSLPFNPAYAADCVVNIQPGANLSGQNAANSFGATLRTGTGTFGNLTINNHGNVWGRGGNGINGNGQFPFWPQFAAGAISVVNTHGKDAILAERACHIINHATGKIYGGGGGGAIGFIVTVGDDLDRTFFRSGGSAGAGGGVGGAGEKVLTFAGMGANAFAGKNGNGSSNSTTSIGGGIVGFEFVDSFGGTAFPASGGAGGNFGQKAPDLVTSLGTKTGGNAGRSVRKSSAGIVVTISNQGDILGPNDAA